MGRFKFVILLILPLFGFAQDYPRFELYQLVQGQDSGQFVTTGVDSNLDFNSILRFRFQDSTLLIGADTVITDTKIVSILLATIDAGLGIEVNQVDDQIFIESLSIEDSIYNGSGSIIEKGTPLYASDTQGNYWDVAPARADDPSKMPVVIIAGEEIGIGETGLGLIKGHIKQVNTTGLADGSEVYVDASGGYTSTKPTAEGVIIQRLGTVIKGETTNGSGIINLGDEGFWNDYTSLSEFRDTIIAIRSDILSSLLENRMYIGSASNTTTTIEATDSRVSNTIIKRDANGKFASNFIDASNGYGNVGIGYQVLNNINNSVYFNTAVGHQAGFNLTSGERNNFYGWQSGYNITSGSYNTFYGNRSGNLATTGSNNTFIGHSSGLLVTTGSNNTFVGYNTEGDNTSSNSIAIGYDVEITGSNKIAIGNSSNTELKANNYVFNIDQDLTGKNGFQLTYNSASGEIELDSAGSSGGGGGGIDSVIADQLTILGNGVNETLEVDTNFIATQSFVLDNSGGGGSQWVTSGSDIYYNTGNVGIGNTGPNYPLHVTGRIYSSDDILVDDELIFGTDGTGVFPYIDNVAGKMLISNYLTTSSTLFDFYDRYNTVSPLLINTYTDTYQIEANGAVDIDGNLTQTGTIVQDGGSVTFNNTQSGSYDFGVGSANHLPFMWVDASADKMAVGGGTPAYTLDVTGDINFTGDLYDDGVLFSGGGVTINNNTDNYLLTASGTANTINGEANLTYNGTKLSVSGRIEQTGIGFSTLFGLDAGLNDDLTDNYSTAFGYNALKNNTTGIYNSAFGVRALESITSGSGNNAFGIEVLKNTTTGSSNSGFGNGSLKDVSTGTYNAVFGNSSGDLITTGKQNTIFGSLSGRTLTTGDYNVFIGSDVGASSNSTSNEIAIGHLANGQGSNTIMLGNSSITDLYCYDTSISSPSDKRDKKKIKSLKSGLDFVRELRPVIFEWDMREGTKKGIKDIGFVAQELNKVEKNINEFEYINLTKHDKKLDRWFAQYSNLIPVYAKAIQDLDDKVNQQQIIIESQDKRIRQLEEMVKSLIEKK